MALLFKKVLKECFLIPEIPKPQHQYEKSKDSELKHKMYFIILNFVLSLQFLYLFLIFN